MQQISSTVTRAYTPNTSDTQDVIYPFRRLDLQNICQAIDALCSTGGPAIISIALAHERYLACRQTCGVPRGPVQVVDFHTRSWLHEKRMAGRFKARRLRDTQMLPGLLSRLETDIEPEDVPNVRDGDGHGVDRTDDIYNVTPQTSARRDERPRAAPASTLTSLNLDNNPRQL